MAKVYNPFSKSVPTIVLNGDEEKKIDAKNGPERLVCENKKMVISDDLLQGSQNFLKKLCKITMNSLSSSQEELKSNDLSGYSSDGKENMTRRLSRKFSTPIIIRRQLSETSVDLKKMADVKPLPKGILKTTNQNSLNKPAKSLSRKAISQAKIVTMISSDADSDNSSCSKLNKGVTFHEQVSKKRYKPRRTMFEETQVEDVQKNRLKKLQQRSSSRSPVPSAMKSPVSSDSSEYESSDSEDFTINDKKC